MFMEAVVIKGGEGAAIDKEDIVKHVACTDKEFTIIKDEYVAKGVIKEETNLFGVTLYSLHYDNKED
jgi:non-homologous end joining protein Ku